MKTHQKQLSGPNENLKSNYVVRIKTIMYICIIIRTGSQIENKLHEHLYTDRRQTLQGSFSAVSKPNIFNYLSFYLLFFLVLLFFRQNGNATRRHTFVVNTYENESITSEVPWDCVVAMTPRFHAVVGDDLGCHNIACSSHYSRTPHAEASKYNIQNSKYM